MTIRATSRELDPAALTILRSTIRGEILAPDDAGYDDARRVWNGMVERRPALIARCSDARDVAEAIRFARGRGLEIGVRCGGHSIVGHSVPEGGLMVDLSPMGSVRIDPDRRLAYVGGGALLRDLDRAAAEHGLATTAGNVSHTGVGGLTLGGGMGWLARQFGLSCDNVVAFDVATADGSHLTATADENADLFWGLRGGGGNFGVVTQFTFRLHPISGRVLSADFYYEPDAGPAVLRAFAELAASAPEEATPTAWFGTAQDWPFLPATWRGARVVGAGFVWVGDPDEGRQLIPAFRRIAAPVGELVEEMSYVELQESADEAMRPGMRRYWKDYYLGELSDGAIEALLGRGGPDADGEFLPNGGLQTYGGAIARVGAGESAFSHRDAAYEFVTSAHWEDPADDAGRLAACRRYAAAVEPFSTGAYVNGLADEGEAGVRQAYEAETLTRLITLKDRYDPDNVFHLNHNIPPSAHRA